MVKKSASKNSRNSSGELTVASLYTRCDPKKLGFKTTDTVKDLDVVLGQARAIEAIEFGARIDRPGYNLFVLGPSGTGKFTTVKALLEAKAGTESTPDDWVYVNNFEASHKPMALRLPAGRGAELRDAMNPLIEDLRTAVPSTFESEDYQHRHQAIEDEFREYQEKAFEELRNEAQAKGIALLRTPMGFALAPFENDHVINPEDFARIPKAERDRIEADIEALQAKLEDILKQVPVWERERRERLRALNREVTAMTIGHPIDEIRSHFNDLPQVMAYLQKVEADLVENFHGIMSMETAAVTAALRGDRSATPDGYTSGFNRYRVNLIVNGGDRKGAPVIYQDNPTLPNLVGRVEHLSHMGALETDFTLIKPGALHEANGGYLILDARKLLMQPFSWETLKRVLKAGEITTESLAQLLSLVSTVSLEPEPIPLDVKVVLVGESLIYYLLSALDPEFDDLFKVAADFDDSMDRDFDGVTDYARMIATMIHREELRPFDAAGVARVVEHAARLAGDAEKVSIRLESVSDLLREADFVAGEDGAAIVSARHVQKAIDAQIRRADRVRERIYEQIERRTVLIDTDGARIGQVNGLAVLRLGGFAFGHPTRITARVRLGTGKVVDIEREVELGGALHSKGVLILSGYLASHFVPDQPLSLSASLVFEQTYGGIEGDSASSAELYVLLSALAEAPIKQNFAVTGSVNQMGQVQAIGGVNEKIEGFYDICARRGLTGDQGVLIPFANVKHLMLRHDVVEAVKEGLFHVHAVETIDQGVEILTGTPAGERDADGRFPEGTINGRADDRLLAFAERRRAFAAKESASIGDAAGEKE